VHQQPQCCHSIATPPCAMCSVPALLARCGTCGRGFVCVTSVGNGREPADCSTTSAVSDRGRNRQAFTVLRVRLLAGGVLVDMVVQIGWPDRLYKECVIMQ
jgi:hypothetical protein